MDRARTLATNEDGSELYLLAPEHVTVVDLELDQDELDDLYELWHGRRPDRAYRLQFGALYDKPCRVGRAAQIAYTAQRLGGVAWLHEFGEESGELPDLWRLGRGIEEIAGGNFRVTERGIVD